MKNFIINTTVLVVGLAASVALAEPSQPVLKRVDQYSAEIQRMESSKSPQSLEPVFMLGRAITKEMLKPDTSNPNNPQSPLEAFDNKTLDHVQKEMKGFYIGTDEIVYADPDADFWKALADTKGVAVDKAFFNLYKETYSDGLWPIYMEQQTVISACTKFDDKSLSQTYLSWASFQKKYPEAYKTAVQHELELVSDELETSLCACGDKSSVVTELQYFLEKNPKSDIAAKIKARLNGIDSNKEMIFNCKSG